MTDAEIYSLAEDLETIGHSREKTIRFIFLESKGHAGWSTFMHYFSGRKLISLSHKSVSSSFAYYEPRDETGWAEKYYKGRTLEGPWSAVLAEIQTIRGTFPNLDFIVRETDEHISYLTQEDWPYIQL